MTITIEATRDQDEDGTSYCTECLADLPSADAVCPGCGAEPPVPMDEPASVPEAASPEALAEAAAASGPPDEFTGWGDLPVVALDGTGLDDMTELGGVPSMAAITERPMIPLDIPGVPLIVPRADVTLMFGRGKIGKGRMTWSLISAVTNDGGDVIVIAGEDKQDEQLAARCRASGAVPGRVWDLTRLPGSAVRFKLSAADPEKYPGHIAHLRAFIERLQDAGRDPRAVVIDPLASMIGWGSMLNVQGARRLIEPLQDLADVTGVAIVCIGHTTKDGAKLAGSAGLEQALRLIYRIGVDPVNEAYRVITVEQANNLPPGMDGLRFTVTDDDDGTARVEWLTRAALDEKRTQWRTRLAARETAAPRRVPPMEAAAVTAAAAPLPPGTPVPEAGPAGLFVASYATNGRAGQTIGSLGPHPSLHAAQYACERSPAGRGLRLTWRRHGPGQWVADAERDGAVVAFAVVKAAERRSA